MTPLKIIVPFALSLFSTSSYAELTANKTILTPNDKMLVSLAFDQQVTGDLYIAAEKAGNVFILNPDKISWSTILLGNNGYYYPRIDEQGNPFEEALKPTIPSGTFSEKTPLVEINAKNLSLGNYTLFQIITAKGDNPSDQSARKEVDSLFFEVKPTENSNQKPNTDIVGKYFTPTLPDRTLGDYTDVKNSKAEWDLLESTPEKQKKTLYWDQSQLLGLRKNKLVTFDNLGKKSFTPPPSNIKLRISEPLNVTYITAYPGCIGKGNTNPRLCGEFNTTDFITGSEVFSQRWTRENNLDLINNPLYKDIQNKSKIIYDLSVQVSVEDVMTPAAKENMKNRNIPLAFEMSMSKVPGDFSEKSCKPNNTIQYSSTLTLRMTQKGLKTYDPTLAETCKVDSDELQHYYINVRAVNIDKKSQTINKSQCDQSTECKVHILAFLDDPLSYTDTNGEPCDPIPFDKNFHNKPEVGTHFCPR